jgi:CDGSH-type Zn-finger protein
MFKSEEWAIWLKTNEPVKVIQLFGEDTAEIQKQDSSTINVSISELKKKKNCTCNRSKKYPFCDGTHAS